MHNAIAPFRPHGWQHAPLRDFSQVMLLTGSAGGGKSRLAAEKIHAYCLRYPNSTALMLRKTRESTTNSIVLFMDRVIMGKDPRVKHVPSKSRFEYENGSILAYGGMKDEQQRENVRSIGIEGGVDIIWLEEAIQFSEDDFNELTGRLRGHAAGWQQIILTTNPDSPYHWIYKRLLVGGEASVHKSSALDNPSNPANYLRILQRMTGVLRARLVEGKWIIAEGTVYDAFDPNIHLIDRIPAGGLKRYIAAVDWGYTNPGVMQVWGLDSDDRMYMVYERYRTQELVADTSGKDGFWINEAKEIKRRFGVQSFMCDPSEPAYIETLRRAAIPAYPADNEIKLGVQRVKNRLQIAGDGKPRLYILRGAMADPDPYLVELKKPTSSIEEISLYVWPKAKDGQVTKEVPVKENDHGMDTMRYAVAKADAPQGVGMTHL